MNDAAGGALTWYIPDCYWPEISSAGHYVSHEAICVLNTGDVDAKLELTLYFEDRDPVEGFSAICQAKRTNHVRLDLIRDKSGRHIPKGVPYALMVKSNVNVIIQYSRLDTTQSELTLMTTIAHPL